MAFCNTYKEVVPPQSRNTACCTVYAWSVVFNKPFDLCKEYLSKYNYIRGKGMILRDVERAFGDVRKHKVAKGGYTPQNRITISRFIKEHPEGRFYCVVRGHALAIIDGVVYDHCEKPRRQIQHAWRVYLPEENIHDSGRAKR